MADLGTAVVTGGGSGIGLAIARDLLREGWKLLLADVSVEALQAARSGFDTANLESIRCVQMNVADEASVVTGLAQGLDGFGEVRGLVNSAGIGRDVSFFDTSVELFRKILDINLIGTFVVAREVARRMKAHGGGAIVNISSVAGLRGSIGRSAYGASKGGVVTLTQVMAAELAPENIRVNAIAPGPVNTPMVETMHNDTVRAAWLRHIPQRRYAAPEEIAGVASFLLVELHHRPDPGRGRRLQHSRDPAGLSVSRHHRTAQKAAPIPGDLNIFHNIPYANRGWAGPGTDEPDLSGWPYWPKLTVTAGTRAPPRSGLRP